MPRSSAQGCTAMTDRAARAPDPRAESNDNAESIIVHHLGDGIYIALPICEYCGKRFNLPMRHGYTYRPICPPCSDERGEPWEMPKEN